MMDELKEIDPEEYYNKLTELISSIFKWENLPENVFVIGEVEMITKHNELMKALKEIKLICSLYWNVFKGCDSKCPFIMENKEDPYRNCEVMQFINPHIPDTPSEWGEDDDT